MRTCGNRKCGASLEGRRPDVKFCNSACRQRAFHQARGEGSPERVLNKRDALDEVNHPRSRDRTSVSASKRTWLPWSDRRAERVFPAMPGMSNDRLDLNEVYIAKSGTYHESGGVPSPAADPFWREARSGARIVKQHRSHDDCYEDFNPPRRPPRAWFARIADYARRYIAVVFAERHALRLEKIAARLEHEKAVERIPADVVDALFDSDSEPLRDMLHDLVRSSDRLPQDRGRAPAARTAGASPGRASALASEHLPDQTPAFLEDDRS